MLKDTSFALSPAILKYLIVIILMWVIFILYVAKLNQIEPESTETLNQETVLDVETIKLPFEEIPTPSISSDGVDTLQESSSEISPEALFQNASQAIEQGDEQSAMTALAELIELYPQIPEAYANLGSLQARNGQLAEARATLLKGIRSNPAYAAVFSNLQKVQGLMAANAYRSALVDESKLVNEIELPIIDTIGTDSLSLTSLSKRRQVPSLSQEQQPLIKQAVNTSH